MLIYLAINNYLSFVLAVVSNSLLVFLIVNYTTKEMRKYSKILLFTCGVDAFACTVTVIAQPVYSVVYGFGLLVGNGGLSRWIGHEYWFGLGWNLSFFYSITFNAVQFIYRYLVLCREVYVSMCTFLLINLVASSWVWAVCVIIYIKSLNDAQIDAIVPEGATLRRSVAELMHESKADGAHFLICVISDTYWTLALCYTIVCCVLVYAVVLVCAHRINRFSRQLRNKRVDCEISRILMLQASTPLILITSAIVILLSAYMHGSAPVSLTSWMMEPLAWIPVINPLVAIFAVKSYRRRVLFMIRWAARIATIVKKNSAEPPSSTISGTIGIKTQTRTTICP